MAVEAARPESVREAVEAELLHRQPTVAENSIMEHTDHEVTGKGALLCVIFFPQQKDRMKQHQEKMREQRWDQSHQQHTKRSAADAKTWELMRTTLQSKELRERLPTGLQLLLFPPFSFSPCPLSSLASAQPEGETSLTASHEVSFLESAEIRCQSSPQTPWFLRAWIPAVASLGPLADAFEKSPPQPSSSSLLRPVQS